MKNKILELNQVYNENYNTFCYQNCLKYILEAYGVINADLYINKTLSLILKSKDLFSLDIGYDEAARSLLPAYDYKVRRYLPIGKSKEEVLEENIEELKKGKPIVVGVDSFYLSHMPYYKKSHGRHTMILADCDIENEKVTVVDWMEPWCYKGDIQLQEFLVARDSQNENDGGIFSGLSIENNWAEMDDFGWHETKNELIAQTINISLEQYYSATSENETEIKGIYALQYICHQLNELENISDDEQKEYLKLLHKKLYVANKRKIFFKDFLDGIKEDYVKIAIERFNNINQQWDKFLYKIIKASMRRKSGYTISLVDKMKEIVDEEAALEKELIKVLNYIE